MKNRGQMLWIGAMMLSTLWVIVHYTMWHSYLRRTEAVAWQAGTDTLPFKHLIPSFAYDGLAWLNHAKTLESGEALRVQTVVKENAPYGRPNYWNTPWAWYLLMLGQVSSCLADVSFNEGLETGAFWANLPLWLVALVGFSAWGYRREGAGFAVILALGMAGLRGFYEGFHPGYCDHHGLINVLELGFVLSVFFALRTKSEAVAKRDMMIAGVFVGCGFWVSTFSTLPILAMVIVASWMFPFKEGAAFRSPKCWRWFGLVGAGVVVLGLMVEFSGWEHKFILYNNLIYALIVCGAAEVLAGSYGLKCWRARVGDVLRRWAFWLLIVFGGMWLILFVEDSAREAFVLRVHVGISEMKSLVGLMEESAVWAHLDKAMLTVLPLVLGAWLWWRKRGDAVLLWVMFIATPVCALVWFQNRWFMPASCVQLLLIAVLYLRWKDSDSVEHFGKVAVLSLVFFVWGCGIYLVDRLSYSDGQNVAMGETLELLYRDVSARLRQEKEPERMVVLSSPNASIHMGYFGQLPTVCTLYWENGYGLKRAAQLLTESNSDQVAEMMRKDNVTHVVLFSHASYLPDFGQAMEPPRSVETMWSVRLLRGGAVPEGFRRLPYAVPVPFRPLGFRVIILEVLPKS